MKHAMIHLGMIGILVGQAACSTQARSESTGENSMNANSHAVESDSGQSQSKNNGREHLSVNVDVGEINLRFDDIDVDYKVSWKKGGSCDEIKIVEKSAGLEVKHIDRDQSCGGTRIDLVIREDLSTKVTSGAGSIVVEETVKLLKQARVISAEVMAGTIDSDVSGIDITRSWSQARARYTNGNEEGIELELALGAGTIEFVR